MSRHRVAGGIPVRGTCTAGHVTEATSDPGRTTWEGVCAHEGCELKVKATRRAATVPPAPDDPPPASAPEPEKPPRLRQVDYDRAPRKRDQQPAAPAGGSGGTAEPDPAAPTPQKSAGGPVQREPARTAAEPEQQPAEPVRAARAGRIRERITGRRQQGSERKRATREFRLPY